MVLSIENNYFVLFDRWIITGTTTPGQSGPESNCNGEVLHIP